MIAATSHFPGAPNPALSGLEVLNVPAGLLVDEYVAPHTVVPNPQSPNRSIVFPSLFTPRNPAAAAFLNGVTFAGNVFHDGMASAMLLPFGEIGQRQVEATPLIQSPHIPNFPAILPPSFDDPNGGTSPIPPSFGARRTSFNLVPGPGLPGLLMLAALDDELLIQPTGYNVLAQFGLTPTAPIAPLRIALPAGWITTTEILSL